MGQCNPVPFSAPIQNAGISLAHQLFNKSKGHDGIIQVNYISTALLAILLLPVIKEKRVSGRSARSKPHHFHELEDRSLDQIQGRKYRKICGTSQQ